MVCAGPLLTRECPHKKLLEQAEALTIQSVPVRSAENRLLSYAFPFKSSLRLELFSGSLQGFFLQHE